MASVYEFGGKIGEIFYSYDLWVVGKFLWERWNMDMVDGLWTPFDELDSVTKAKVLDIAYDVIGKIKGDHIL